MWCPKTNANGSRNINYKMMRTVEPGDVVFSFRNRMITHIGIVISGAFDARKPTAFGASGAGWLDLGWKVIVEYEPVPTRFTPAMHMNKLLPLLPDKYSPLQKNGAGNQIYFTTLSDVLGSMLLALSGMKQQDVQVLVAMIAPMIEKADAFAIHEAEEILRLEEQRIDNLSIPNTEKLALIASRVGQGAFREAVLRIEPSCRITGVTDPKFLRASHIKPWRDADDAERLDQYNGLMLTPTIDHLFDRGYISFMQTGKLLVATNVDDAVWSALHIPVSKPHSVGLFLLDQQRYLEYHRDVIFQSV